MTSANMHQNDGSTHSLQTNIPAFVSQKNKSNRLLVFLMSLMHGDIAGSSIIHSSTLENLDIPASLKPDGD